MPTQEIARRIGTSNNFVYTLLRATKAYAPKPQAFNLNNWTSVRNFLEKKCDGATCYQAVFEKMLSAGETARLSRALWRSLKKHLLADAVLAEVNAMREVFRRAPFTKSDAELGLINPWSLRAAARAYSLNRCRERAMREFANAPRKRPGNVSQAIIRAEFRYFAEMEREKEL